MKKLIILFALCLTTLSSQITVKATLLDSLLKQAKKAKIYAKALEESIEANRQAEQTFEMADSTIAALEMAFLAQKEVSRIDAEIIKAYKGRAKEGNRLVTTALVGIVAYIAYDGNQNEKPIVFGSMGVTYIATRIFGAPFDLFTIDLIGIVK